MLNMVLVGCGEIADAHADALRYSPKARLTAVCDTEPLRAEQLAMRYWVGEYQQDAGFELVVLRPGVIYGPGSAFSVKVGLQLPGLFLHPGGSNTLPLSYVENCAEAIAVVGSHPDSAGETYTVQDDDLLSASQYLRLYHQTVEPIRRVRIRYRATQAISSFVEWYHGRSHGQMPAVFTPYRTESVWNAHQFDNRKLRGAAWNQLVQCKESLWRALESLASENLCRTK